MSDRSKEITDRITRVVKYDMQEDDDRLTPPPRRRHGELTLDDRLDGLEEGQQKILEKLTQFSGIHIRIRALEFVVYGSCSIAGVGVIGSLLYLILKGGPAGHP